MDGNSSGPDAMGGPAAKAPRLKEQSGKGTLRVLVATQFLIPNNGVSRRPAGPVHVIAKSLEFFFVLVLCESDSGRPVQDPYSSFPPQTIPKGGIDLIGSEVDPNPS